jgi:hypothetical protein
MRMLIGMDMGIRGVMPMRIMPMASVKVIASLGRSSGKAQGQTNGCGDKKSVHRKISSN